MTALESKLTVDDGDFLVASLIDRCPRVMMLRELVMNALEAAAGTREGRGHVWIGATELDGVRKLTIRNSGPGMRPEILHQMCNIAASMGKEKGLHGNFGMGAKVASLPSNPLGVRYRSCAEGRVFEVIIGKFDGVYGRLLRRTRDGRAVDIVEVTPLYDADARARDWTEVVLFGERETQDTLADPYGGDPAVANYWIPTALYHRFYRIPANVDVELAENVHWFEGARPFRAIADRRSSFARSEAVDAGKGVTIHYLYDPAHEIRSWENASSEGALQSAASTAGIVYRGELYDLRTGSPWVFESPRYGVTFAARHVSVHLELPDDYPVVPDTYRQFLRYADGAQSHVELDQFMALVRAHRPAWLLELFDEFGLSARMTANLDSELKSLRRDLGVLLYEPNVYADGYTPTPEDIAAWVEPELEIVQLADEVDINDRWLKGRAACYYRDTHQLFFNTQYHSVVALSQRLVELFNRDHPGQALAEPLRIRAAAVATEAVIRRVARALLFGLAKASQPELWQRSHIDKATAPEALSVVADDWLDMAPEAYQTLKREFTQSGLVANEPGRRAGVATAAA